MIAARVPGVLATVALAAVVLAPPATSAPSAQPPTGLTTVTDARMAASGADALEVVSHEREGRLHRFVVATPALAKPVRVNVLLPRGYSAHRRHYPTLYLFHGTNGGADDWLDLGHLRELTRERPMVLVVPDMGYDQNGGSFFTDWVDQTTPLGAADWETFHIDQLVPWVDRHFRTRPVRSARAIAGLSQGGFGAFSYAARHPDMFVSAAAFSPPLDIAEDPAARAGGELLVSAVMTAFNQVQPDAPFGSITTDLINWRGHNPASLVTNLADTDLRIWCGDGTPGPLDDLGPDTPVAGGIEAAAHLSTGYFVQAADAAGVRFRYRDYGPGTHAWAYWTRDLRQYLPHLARVFAQHRPRPRAVSYRSVERRWTQWGWTVQNRRAEPQAWSRLRRATAGGFVLEAGEDGTTPLDARVTTPPAYVAGATYRLDYRSGTGPRTAVAGRRGRLSITLSSPTGPVRVEVHR